MFITRTISGLILCLILFGLIFPGGLVLAIGMCMIGCIGYHELYKALAGTLEKKGIDVFEIIGILGTILWYAALYFFKLGIEAFGVMLVVLFVMMGIYIFRFPKHKCEKAVESFFAFIYCPVLLSFIYLSRELPYGVYTVWLIFIASWISDTGAYLLGRAIGKHKLAPVLSPKKSIEGAIGGIIASASVGALYGFVLGQVGVLDIPFQIANFAIIGGVGSILSQLGDLAASGIKRDRGVKDYGKLIPGHGGIMDRFDSVIVTSPIIFFLAYYLIH